MFDWLRRKSATLTTVPLERLAEIAGFVSYGTAAAAAVRPETAVAVSAVFCAARVISEGGAQVPVRVLEETYRDDGLPIRRVARDHWAHRLLAERPNEWQTSYEFREYAFIAAALDRGFLGIKNIVDGEVREILPVPMGCWRVNQKADWKLEFEVSFSEGNSKRFAQQQVMYLRGPSLNGYAAVSAVDKAREAIGLASVLEKQQSRLAGNGGKPSGVLSFAEPLKDETKKRLQELWQEKFGPNGEGGVAILDGEASFSSMTMTGVDAQHLETRKHQIEEIARAFRVLPIMLMHGDKTATYASAEQMFRHHVIHTLGPWMARFEQAANRDILGDEYPALRVDLDERGLLRGDFKDQAEYYTRALGAGGQPGWMTPNEIRTERDMNPVDDDWANQIPRGTMEAAGNGNQVSPD